MTQSRLTAILSLTLILAAEGCAQNSPTELSSGAVSKGGCLRLPLLSQFITGVQHATSSRTLTVFMAPVSPTRDNDELSFFMKAGFEALEDQTQLMQMELAGYQQDGCHRVTVQTPGADSQPYSVTEADNDHIIFTSDQESHEVRRFNSESILITDVLPYQAFGCSMDPPTWLRRVRIFAWGRLATGTYPPTLVDDQYIEFVRSASVDAEVPSDPTPRWTWQELRLLFLSNFQPHLVSCH
ncbi:MAG TPA: hypothetical protein VL588_07960 [Bdellovibrionota bacterium]|jgi:hypothetical protein|nr:hypothetical protein [Bdellovibrionota bacterium]